MEEIELKEAKSKEEFQIAAVLFQEYVDQLAIDLDFQNFSSEMSSLEVQYARPKGALFLARNSSNDFLGCFAIRDFEGSICELKRMYLRKEARGLGIGESMLKKAIEIGQQLGYDRMRLDTLPSMHAAQTLYRKMGFYEIEPYRYNPISGTKFLEIRL